MLEGNIRQENKIPGCTKMTRPEEISALRKYLGKIKEVQEEHTNLEKDVLEVPGRTTGRIPKITALEDRLYKLDNSNSGIVSSLIHESELLPENRNKKEGKLSTGRENIPGEAPFVNSLSKKSLEVPGEFYTPDRLENGRENIPGEKIGVERLREDKDRIPGSQINPELGNEKETLPGSRPNISSLPTVAELLAGYTERIKGLSGVKESLPESFNRNSNLAQLSKEKEILNEGKRPELKGLESSSENLPSSKNPSSKIESLGDAIEKLEGEIPEVSKLSGWSEKISGEKVEINELETEKISLKGVKELDSLEKISEDLPGKRPEINELPNKWERIVGDEDNFPKIDSLSKEIKELPGNIEDPNLGQVKEKLPGTIEELNQLENGREDIPGKLPTIESLSKTQEKLEGITSLDSLSDTFENIPGEKKEVDTLSQTLESLPESENLSDLNLSSIKEDIPGEKVEPELEKGLIDLPTSENPGSEIKELSKTREELLGENKIVENLSTTIENLSKGTNPKAEITELSLDSENIPGEKKEVELSKEREDIKGEISNPDSLSDYVEKIQGETPEISSLSDQVETLPESENDNSIIDGLSDHVEKLEPGVEDIDSLSDYIDKLEPNPEDISNLPTELTEDGKLIGDPKIPTELSDYVDELNPKPEEIEELPTELTPDGKIEGDIKEPETLSDHVEKLEPGVEDIDSLSDYQEKMEPGAVEVEALSDYQEKLEPGIEEIDLLSDYQEKLEPGKEDIDSLSDYQEKLEPGVVEIESLSDYQEKLNPEREEVDSLSDHVEKLEPPKADVEELSNAVLGMEENKHGEPEELSDVILGMYDNQHESPEELSDHIEKMEPLKEDINSLSDYQEKMTPGTEDVDSLSDHQEKMLPGAEEIDSLSDYQEKMQPGVEEVESLSDYVEKLEPGKEDIDSLSDYQEKLTPGIEEVEALSDYQEKLNPPSEEVEELSDIVLDLYDNQHEEVEELSDIILQIEENQHDEVNTLSDYQEKIFGVEDVDSLSDHLEKREIHHIEKSRANGEQMLSDEPEELYDSALGMVENRHNEPEELYDSALGMVENRHKEPDKLVERSEVLDLTGKPEDYFHPQDMDEDMRPKYSRLKELMEADIQDGDLDSWQKENPNVADKPELIEGTNRPHYEWVQEEATPENLDQWQKDHPNLQNNPLDWLNEEERSTGGLRKDWEDVGNLNPEELEEWQKSRPEAKSRPKNIEGEDRPSYELVTEITSGDELLQWQKEKLETFIEKAKAAAVHRDDSEKYEKLLELLNDEILDEDVAKKFKTIASAYLSSDRKLPPQKMEEFEHRLIKEGELLGIYDNEKEDRVRMPWYQAPKLSLGSFNASSWIRKLAEEIIGSGPRGSTRSMLLNETIAMLCLAAEQLQILSKSEPWRLPGSGYGVASDAAGLLLNGGNVANAAGNAVSTAIAGATGGINMKNPVNAPKTGLGGASGFIGGLGASGKEPTKGWNSKISMRQSSTAKKDNSFKAALSGMGKALLGIEEQDYTFKGNYLQGEGIGVTLEELCKGDIGSIESVEDFYALLSLSPYITTPEQFTTTKRGSYKCWTLDSNAYWEVILEPYLGAANGNYSFLPAFEEINLRNKDLHGVTTSYSKWVPFVGFDLQKSKLVSKTTGLYDGEIAFPVSMEFTNEFRLTLVDDQYKSWKTFWETVAEVSVYSSLPHASPFYNNPGTYTVIDTQNIVPANYKNITWRCRIFVMTPQLSTIKRYDLLLVMKDMVEEYSGDIDGAAQDLTITFSIVGENPSDVDQYFKGPDKVDAKKIKDWATGDGGKDFRGDGWDIASMAGELTTKGLSLIT